MRLIDADALIDSLKVDPIECCGCPEPEWLEQFIDILNNAPTYEVEYRIKCENMQPDELFRRVVRNEGMVRKHG